MTTDRILTALKPAALDDVDRASEDAMDTRLAEIIATPRRPDQATARARRVFRMPLLLTATGAGIAAVAVAAVLPAALRDDAGSGPVRPEPTKIHVAAALSFSEEKGYLHVVVNDPVADPARYRKEFAARGLDVDLTLAPVSRRKAGTVIFMEQSGDSEEIKTITAKGRCKTSACHVGVMIPQNFKGHLSVVFGRPARPGEQYDTGSGDTPGEGVGLSNVKNRTVADVLAEAKRRHISRIEFRYEHNGTGRRNPIGTPSYKGYQQNDNPYPNGIPADKVKPEWYVHDALPGSTGQVILFVGPDRTG